MAAVIGSIANCVIVRIELWTWNIYPNFCL